MPCSQDPPAIEIVSSSRTPFLPANAEINRSNAWWETKTASDLLQGEHFLKVHYLLCKVIQAQADRSILGGFQTAMHCWFWHQCELCAYSLPEPLAGQVARRSALNTGDWWEKGCARESLQSLIVRMDLLRRQPAKKDEKYTVLTITNKHHQTSFQQQHDVCRSWLHLCNTWSSSASLFGSINHTGCAHFSSVKPKSVWLGI